MAQGEEGEDGRSSVGERLSTTLNFLGLAEDGSLSTQGPADESHL